MGGQTAFEKKKMRHASGESTISTDSVSHYIPIPPDGGYGWVIVFASFMNHVIVDGITYTFGVFFVEFLDYFDEGKSKTSLAGSLLTGCYLFAAPVASALVNKFGCQPVAVTGSLIATTGFILCTFSTNVNILILTYGVIGGCGLGLLYLPNIVAVSYYFQDRRALATGIAVCGAGVGCFVFAPLGRLLLDIYHWKCAMLIVAGITLNGCVFGLLLRPLQPIKRPRRPRAKNILDRLKEQTAHRMGRHRKESECSVNSVSKDREVFKKIQQIKWAKETALHEDEDSISDLGSMLNSVRRLDQIESPVMFGHLDAGHHGNISSPLENVMEKDERISEANVGKLNGYSTEHDSSKLEDEKMNSINEQEDESKSNYPHSPSSPPPPCSPPPSSSPLPSSNPPSCPLTLNCPPLNSPSVTIVDVSLTQEPSKIRPTSILRQKENNYPSAMCVENSMRLRLPHGIHKSDYARPLYRSDIFYSGSVFNIPERKSQPDVHNYVKSVTAIPDEIPAENECFVWRYFHMSKAAKDTLRQMTDVSLLKDPLLLIPALSNLVGFIGLYIPFVFMADRAISLHVPENQAALLLSVIGITNTIGRIGAGSLADLKGLNSLLLHNIALLLGGITCILNMFCTTYVLMCVFAAVFGLCVATWISLTSIILCDLLGLEKLTNAFGLLCMARGVAAVVGSPAAGLVFDATQNYDAPFHVSGVMLIIGGLLCCLLHLSYFKPPNDEEDVDLSDDGDEQINNQITKDDSTVNNCSEEQTAKEKSVIV